jgi:hypothetical protein
VFPHLVEYTPDAELLSYPEWRPEVELTIVVELDQSSKRCWFLNNNSAYNLTSHLFVGLAYQGKDIVFRFIIEDSGDFGP